MSADHDEAPWYLQRPVLQLRQGAATQAQDALAEERPVSVHVNGEPYAVMMATPRDLEDFAFGFALTEGLATPAQIEQVEVQTLLEGIVLEIHSHAPLPEKQARHLPGRSGCGICGSRLLEEVIKRPPRLTGTLRTDTVALEKALAALEQRQPLASATGATHAAAWADAGGHVHLVREDVGRHNALDKLIGALLRQGVDPGTGLALVTSRASYEMVTKAAVAGIPLLAAISAPTALAVHLAEDCGLTLVGFMRPGRCVVYSHGQRLGHAQD